MQNFLRRFPLHMRFFQLDLSQLTPLQLLQLVIPFSETKFSLTQYNDEPFKVAFRDPGKKQPELDQNEYIGQGKPQLIAQAYYQVMQLIIQIQNCCKLSEAQLLALQYNIPKPSCLPEYQLEPGQENYKTQYALLYNVCFPEAMGKEFYTNVAFLNRVSHHSFINANIAALTEKYVASSLKYLPGDK